MGIKIDATKTYTDKEMFELMLKSLGIKRTEAITKQVETNLMNEVDTFAMENDFHHNGINYVHDFPNTHIIEFD